MRLGEFLPSRAGREEGRAGAAVGGSGLRVFLRVVRMVSGISFRDKVSLGANVELKGLAVSC